MDELAWGSGWIGGELGLMEIEGGQVDIAASEDGCWGVVGARKHMWTRTSADCLWMHVRLWAKCWGNVALTFVVVEEHEGHRDLLEGGEIGWRSLDGAEIG